MKNQPPPEEAHGRDSAGPAGGKPDPVATIQSSPPAIASACTEGAGDTAPANTLTPEEQMALFAQELKEKDWGHQPC